LSSLALTENKWKFERVQEIDSTSSELMRRAKSGRFESTLLVAREQTAGRGRQGRTWVSEADQALTCSLGFLFNPKDWMGLSLAVGVSLLKAIDPKSNFELGLKWPNDIWHIGSKGPAKLAGILIETVSTASLSIGDSSRYCIIGIGLNRSTPNLAGFKEQFPQPIGLSELGGSMTEDDLLSCILTELTPALSLFETQGFKPFKSAFDLHDLLKNHEVSINAIPFGVAAGVSENGELLVETPTGLKNIVSQEVSVRPSLFSQ
jgi:BirA family biotin operon repressor/biotin-[acetyl-CoA-carboxylase] ligase